VNPIAIHNETWSWLPWAVVIAAALAGAIWDIRSRRIPNRLTGPVLAAGLVWATCVGGAAGLGNSLLAVIGLGLPYVLLFMFAHGGAGDAKLMAALGAWLGLSHGLLVLICVMLAGGILGVLFAISKRRFLLLVGNMAGAMYGLLMLIAGRARWREIPDLLPRFQNMQTMPYAVAILVGVCAAAGGLLWHAI
jgi:prepilin peptidase CpaA